MNSFPIFIVLYQRAWSKFVMAGRSAFLALTLPCSVQVNRDSALVNARMAWGAKKNIAYKIYTLATIDDTVLFLPANTA